MAYSDNEIKFLVALKEEADLSWEEIAVEWNDRYGGEVNHKTPNALRKTYFRYKNEDVSDDALIKNIRERHTARKTASKLRRENKVLVEHQIDIDEVLGEIEKLIKEANLKTYEPKKTTGKDEQLTSMTMEALLSDIHYGLKTKSYNANVTRERIKRYTNAFLDEKHRYSKNFNVEKFRVLLNGDVIQSATMHKDSEKSCHLTNAQQMAVAIESLFYDFLLPIALEGEETEVIGMGGNHDREGSDRFTVEPGTSYYSYTIYKALELLCKASGLTNVKFTIPKGPYYIYESYGHWFVVEHGDLLRNCKPETLEDQLMQRSAQAGRILKGIRIGHYHSDYVGSVGRHIVNGGVPSDDHYSDGLGYVSRPCQLINYYVKTKKRDTSYYHTFVVNLG